MVAVINFVCFISRRSTFIFLNVLFLPQENQVMALKEKGIAAEYLSSTQAAQVKDKVPFVEMCIHFAIQSAFMII